MAHARTGDVLRFFMPLAITGVLLVGITYSVGEQMLRQGANEPQLGNAHDLANALANSPAGPSTLSPSVDIGASLSPYLVVYNAYGTPVTGTGTLHGALPALPAGVFDVVRGKGEDRITWQPEMGVREAIVVVPVAGGAGGFVMGGRSLAYVEQEERELGFLCLAGLAAMLLAALLGAYVAAGLKR
jgi:hypothetical protein